MKIQPSIFFTGKIHKRFFREIQTPALMCQFRLLALATELSKQCLPNNIASLLTLSLYKFEPPHVAGVFDSNKH